MNRMAVNPAYGEITRLQLHQRIAYPLNLLLEWTKVPIILAILHVIYGHIYQSNPNFAGMTLNVLTQYLFIAFVFRKMAESMGESFEVEEEIKKGDIFTYLTRPINYFRVRLAKQFGNFLSHSIAAIPLLYILSYFLLGNLLPIETFIPGFLLALFGSIAVFQLYYCVGLLAFWFEETWGFRRVLHVLIWLFSGSAVPIALLPNEVRTLSFLLPFQHQAATPALFTLGQVSWDAYGQSLLILAGWILLLGIIQTWLWKKGLLKHDGKG